MSDITININGIKYEWFGGFGAVIKSYEKDVKVGDCRIISGTLFYAYMVINESNSLFSKKRDISWSMPDITIEKINAFRKKILGE